MPQLVTGVRTKHKLQKIRVDYAHLPILENQSKRPGAQKSEKENRSFTERLIMWEEESSNNLIIERYNN